MKTRFKMLVTAVLAGGVLFGAVGQINLNANEVRMGSSSASVELRSGSFSRVDLNARYVTLMGQHISLIPTGFSVSERDMIIYGNLTLTGNLNGVSPKHFIHPHPNDSSKVIRYVTIESAEALTLARGTARTVNGEVAIALPEHFAMVTNKNIPLTIHLTPKGAPVLLYVKQESTEQIVVAMKKSDFSEYRDVEFSFQVTGIRDGFEKLETIVDIDVLKTTTPARDDIQKRIDVLVERMRPEWDGKMEE